jgi:hypothetical protein
VLVEGRYKGAWARHPYKATSKFQPESARLSLEGGEFRLSRAASVSAASPVKPRLTTPLTKDSGRNVLTLSIIGVIIPHFEDKFMNALEERVKTLIEQYEERRYIGRDSFDRQFDEIFQDRYTYNRLPLDLRNEAENLRSFGRNREKIKEAEQQVKQLSDLYRNHKVSEEEFEKRYSAITAKDITGKSAYDRIPKDL